MIDALFVAVLALVLVAGWIITGVVTWRGDWPGNPERAARDPESANYIGLRE